MTINSVDSFVSAKTWLVPYIKNEQVSYNYMPTVSFGAQPAYPNSFGTFGYTGSIPTGGINITGAYTGGWYTVPDAPPGKQNYLISIHGWKRTNAVKEVLCDILWACTGANNASTSVGIYSSSFPARDTNGTNLGSGVYLGVTNIIKVSSTSNTNYSGATVEYTNSDGVPNRTGTTYNFASMGQTTMAQSVFWPIMLQEGDVGVRSVQRWFFKGLALSNFDKSLYLIAYRPLAEYFPTSSSSIAPVYGTMADNGMPILYSGCSLLFISYNNNTYGINGSFFLRLAQG